LDDKAFADPTLWNANKLLVTSNDHPASAIFDLLETLYFSSKEEEFPGQILNRAAALAITTYSTARGCPRADQSRFLP
jgi:hypothetical protein